MPRYAMVISQERCVGCQSCTVACRSEWDVPVGSARTRVHQTAVEGALPECSSVFHVAQCNQCDRPSCISACPTGATFQEPSGIVRIDKQLCIGCGSCVAACPYGARYINSSKGKADKCDFCFDRLTQGLEPACVLTCPGKAKVFGDLEDTRSSVFDLVYRKSARRMETPDVAIGPNVFYLGTEPHLEMAAAAFPPRRPRTIAAVAVWGALAKKLVMLAVSATFLGQAVAFIHQLRTGEHQFEE